MSIINKPNTFSPNTSISSSQVNSNFDTLYNDYNGSISAANLANNAVTTAKIADGAVTASKLASGLVDSGWVATLGTHSVSTGYNSGNRSFEIDTSTDLSGVVSPGMRYKVDRSVAPPDQCADLEASSSQYASKSSPSGITFTTTYTCEAWVKLESYGFGGIIARRNGSTEGWGLNINANGQLDLTSYRIASNYKQAVSYQSIPLGRWVHVAVSMDMTAGATSGATWYIDGVSVPGTVTQIGTATALVQGTTALVVGAAVSAGTSNFDGKIADVRVWSDIRTATEIRDNMFVYPADTTNLVAHFKLDGDFTDSSTNGNDLTAQNSAAATNADNPWNATEYGVITAVTSSTIQVFCPEGYGIPNETLTSPFYSTQDTPYGFPRDKSRWVIETLINQIINASGNTAGTWYGLNGCQVSVPIGSFTVGYDAFLDITTTGTQVAGEITLSKTSAASDDSELTSRQRTVDGGGSATRSLELFNSRSKNKNHTTTTTYYLNVRPTDINSTSIGITADSTITKLFAKCAYI